MSSHTLNRYRALALRTLLGSLLFLVLSLTVFSIPAQAIPFTLNYTGTLALSPFGARDPVDVAGLDGAHFHWTGTFDSSAVRVGSNGGSATQSYFQSTTPISLELTQTVGAKNNGTFPLEFPSSNQIAEFAGVDTLSLTSGGALFAVFVSLIGHCRNYRPLTPGSFVSPYRAPW
jgi:hypothetical protein